jgi:hypothetical protein
MTELRTPLQSQLTTSKSREANQSSSKQISPTDLLTFPAIQGRTREGEMGGGAQDRHSTCCGSGGCRSDSTDRASTTTAASVIILYTTSSKLIAQVYTSFIDSPCRLSLLIVFNHYPTQETQLRPRGHIRNRLLTTDSGDCVSLCRPFFHDETSLYNSARSYCSKVHAKLIQYSILLQILRDGISQSFRL